MRSRRDRVQPEPVDERRPEDPLRGGDVGRVRGEDRRGAVQQERGHRVEGSGDPLGAPPPATLGWARGRRLTAAATTSSALPSLFPGLDMLTGTRGSRRARPAP